MFRLIPFVPDYNVEEEEECLPLLIDCYHLQCLFLRGENCREYFQEIKHLVDNVGDTQYKQLLNTVSEQ